MTSPSSLLTLQIRSVLNATHRVRLIRNNVGFVPLPRPLHFGLGTGSPDLVGVLRSGRCFCIEVKVNDRLSPEQAAWWRAARSWGIQGGVARSVAEAQALLEAALSTV